MSANPDIRTLEEARAYAARTPCAGCGKEGTLSAFETRKAGPNEGRLFVKCRHCGRFDWLTAPARRDEELERAQENARPCPQCGKARRAQRVSKEGANKGRLFLVCGDPACDGFEWASPAAQPRAEETPRPTPTEGQRTEEGLLADIRDHPDDDTPRLIYADWLDEHDQPRRAELIRVQVELARLDLNDPALGGLSERSRAILREEEKGWTAALRPFVSSYRYVRGLLDQVEIEASRFAEHADELLRVAPTAELRVCVQGWQDVKVLVRCRQLLRVRRLTLLGEPTGAAGGRILAESPNIAQLKALSLPGQSLGQPGTQALVQSRYVANLEVLDLTENNLSRSAVPLLASSSHLPRLRRLVLARNLLGDSDVRALVNSPHLKGLRELDLSGNAISNEGAEALAGSALLGRLRVLDLSGCEVRQSRANLIREAPRASRELIVRC